MAKKIKHNQKILLMTDSASDIPDDLLMETGIVMLPIPISIEGKGYLERVDFTSEEFYERLLAAKEIPSTSQIPPATYQQAFEDAFDQGYTDIILVTITSKGSNMFSSAVMGKRAFFEARPAARDTMRITILDSGSYTAGYGFPLLNAAEMIRAGSTAEETAAYLDDFFSSCEIVFAAYSLEFAKKSGRIPVAAAFVGDVLGLRPIISIIDGTTKVVEKVRGDKNVVTRIADYAFSRAVDPKAPTAVIYGNNGQYGDDLCRAVAKKFGRAPRLAYNVGASIAINSGPKVVGVVIQGEKRLHTRAREQDYSPAD